MTPDLSYVWEGQRTKRPTLLPLRADLNSAPQSGSRVRTKNGISSGWDQVREQRAWYEYSITLLVT